MFRINLLLVALNLLVFWEATPTRAEGFANLATEAVSSASYVSGDTRLSALNEGRTPQKSLVNPDQAYGNWPRQGTQWVEYEWSHPIHTNRVEVFWWDDQRGIKQPTASRLLYWDGQKFQPVPEAKGLGVDLDKFNVTSFPSIETNKLRLEIDPTKDFSSGVLEWRVLDDGKTEPFPPRVEAGPDRVVVMGGKTYLSAKVKTLLASPELSTKWSKVTGPGEVRFVDSQTAETTATFTMPGEYVLRVSALAGGLEGSSTLAVQAKRAPQNAPLGYVSERRYKLTSPLWKQRIKAAVTTWIPHCYERIEQSDLREGGMNNFIDAANKIAGKEVKSRHRGYTFSNAWVYNTLESMCLALMLDPEGDEEIIAAQGEMKQVIGRWIPIILAAQYEDGYLFTRHTLDGLPRWSDHTAHEGYVAGYFLESAIAMYVLTDGEDRRLYEAGKRLADCWVANIGPPPKQAWFDGHQEMEQALVRFGDFVNEVEGNNAGDSYIGLAKYLLDSRGRVRLGRRGGTEYNQSHVPVQQQYEAVGHAVRAAYSYSAMADIAVEDGDLDYQSAVESLWDNLVNKKYYLTGGIGSGETSEGFGPNYSLRHNAYCESCSGTGELYFQHKLNRLHAHAKYADLYEETLYNAILGDLDLEGENFYYQNPLSEGRQRYDWHVCPCCVGNIPRTWLRLPTWTYMTSDEGVYVNLFVGSEVTLQGVAGGEAQLIQETDYPRTGEVAITVNPGTPRSFAVRLRSPDRDVSTLYSGTPVCDGVESIRVNGEPVEIDIQEGYATIQREWKNGDRIELLLPMVIQRIHASDKIEAIRGQVALRRGPLIYNFEAVDQDLRKAVLAPDAELRAEWRADLLEGVMVITGKFADGSPLLAIPNYARMNRQPKNETEQAAQGRRGGPQSVVWIREATE